MPYPTDKRAAPHPAHAVHGIVVAILSECQSESYRYGTYRGTQSETTEFVQYASIITSVYSGRTTGLVPYRICIATGDGSDHLTPSVITVICFSITTYDEYCMKGGGF